MISKASIIVGDIGSVVFMVPTFFCGGSIGQSDGVAVCANYPTNGNSSKVESASQSA